MKRLLILFFIACTIYCYINATNPKGINPYKEDMPWMIYDLVERYYYSYFNHPKDVDDLIDYAWDVIKDAGTSIIIDASEENYSRRSAQYEDFRLVSDTFYERVKYLEFFKKSIIINFKKEVFHLTNSFDGLFLEFPNNFCVEIKDFDSKLFRHERVFLFDENQKNIFPLNISMLRQQLTKQLINVIRNKKRLQFALLKYERVPNKLTPLCPIDKANNKSFNKIHSILYEFAREHEDIHSIIVLTPIEVHK